MPLRTELNDLVNDLIPLIPEDGTRITNEAIRTALQSVADEPIGDTDLKEIKAQEPLYSNFSD